MVEAVDQKDLVIALTAAGDALRERILHNMNEETRAFIEKEMGLLTRMRLSEVEEVQVRVVQLVRQLEEKGQLTIVRGRDEGPWVCDPENWQEG